MNLNDPHLPPMAFCLDQEATALVTQPLAQTSTQAEALKILASCILLSPYLGQRVFQSDMLAPTRSSSLRSTLIDARNLHE
jgi:hypothetical protein